MGGGAPHQMGAAHLHMVVPPPDFGLSLPRLQDEWSRHHLQSPVEATGWVEGWVAEGWRFGLSWDRVVLLGL